MYEILKKLNPFRIILIWIIGSISFIVAAMIMLGVSTPGGEQAPFTILGKMIPIIVYGVLFLSIITIPFYLSWFRRKWYINFVLIILCIAFIYKDQRENLKQKMKYDEITIPVAVNNKVYFKKTQYYGSDYKKIRSISYTINHQKDSEWVTFSENGAIIERIKYKNDSLVKK